MRYLYFVDKFSLVECCSPQTAVAYGSSATLGVSAGKDKIIYMLDSKNKPIMLVEKVRTFINHIVLKSCFYCNIIVIIRNKSPKTY